MSLNTLNNLSKGLGGTLHRTLDSRRHQGTGRCPSPPISPLMLLSPGHTLLHMSMDTHPLGITPILLSPGRFPHNTGLDPMSLSNHLRSVLINVKGSKTFLQTLIEIKDTAITILMNK